MKVSEALKAKSKLAKTILDNLDKIKKYNCMDDGSTRRYSTKELVNTVLKDTTELISLKAQIHKANVDVYDKIFRMSELKNIVKHLKEVSVDEGPVSRGYSGNVSVVNSEINAVERDEMISNMENEIDRIQSELDKHNISTDI